MKTLDNILGTYNWLNEAFVHQTEEETEQDTKPVFSNWPFIFKKFGAEAISEISNVVFSLEKDRKESYCQFLDALNGFLEDAYRNHPDIWEEFDTYDIRGWNYLCSSYEDYWANFDENEDIKKGKGWGAFGFTAIWEDEEVIEEIGKPHFLYNYGEDPDENPDFEFYWNDQEENCADTADCGIRYNVNDRCWEYY